MNELGEVFRYASDAGAIIVLALVCWGVAGIWGRVAEARIAVDAKRNEIDDKQLSTIEKSASLLDRLLTRQEETNTLIAAKARESSISHNTTLGHVERIGQTLQTATEKMQGVAERGDHQRKRIVESVANNGEKLDEVRVALADLSKQITNGTVPPEIAKQLAEIALKLDECIRLYRTPQPVPAMAGEASMDEKATKES